jgi:hypothetical protein
VKTHVGELMLAYGTAGTDTAAASTPATSGVVHLMSLAPSGRFQTNDLSGTGGVANRSTAATSGTAFELGPYALSNGDRLYGAIQAVGPDLVFSTTQGSVTNIDQRGTLGGSTFHIPLGDTSPVPAAWITGAGGAGGSPLVYYYNGSTLLTPGSGGSSGTTVNKIRILSVTDQKISVADVSIPAGQQNQYQLSGGTTGAIDLVTGAAGGQNGFVRLMGWFYRSLGRER